jgi:hypothetical protein
VAEGPPERHGLPLRGHPRRRGRAPRGRRPRGPRRGGRDRGLAHRLPANERGVLPEPAGGDGARAREPRPLHPALALPRAARRYRGRFRPGQLGPVAVLGVPRSPAAVAGRRGDRVGAVPLRDGQGRARRPGARGSVRGPRRRDRLRGRGEGLGARPGRRLPAGARCSAGGAARSGSWPCAPAARTWASCACATPRSARVPRASSTSRPTAGASDTCSTRAPAGRPRACAAPAS